MKVKELIAKLQEQDQDAPVLLYLEIEEGYGGRHININLYENRDDMPYAKGDKPKLNEKTVLIEG